MAEKSETAQREEKTIAFWNEREIFKKSLEKPAPNGEFVFYDGPPFATGLPHMGHLLASSVKDAVGRYKTMRGFHVRRRWGWDCHGLPIENDVEKKLGLKTKKDIEALGIDTFNTEAKRAVLAYVHEWKRYIERIGRWVDFDHSYKTMDNTYIESVWWGIKQMHDNGLIYEGRKVLMYCPHCETPLAKAEIAMDHSYKDVTDETVTVKFTVTNPEKIGLKGDVYLLAWTTTPWTLPANVALAINPNETYVASLRDDIYVISEMTRVTEGREENVASFSGTQLVGLSYEPLFDVPKNKTDTAYKVYAGDFVTTAEGTGIVHIAPMYGEDDYQLGVKNNLPIVPLLNASGHYNDDAPEFLRGMYFKKANQEVIAGLEKRALVFAKEKYAHSYPHCYRCGTALIYNALTSWFVNIQKIKDRMLALNEDVTWHPEHIKHGRFQNIVTDAPDWNISRNRFWASPLPIWKHEKTGEVHVIGSLEELKQYTKTSGNSYVVMRHGEAENNTRDILDSNVNSTLGLTEKGKGQVDKAAQMLKEKKITRIIASPFLRTKETVERVAQVLGIDDTHIVYDARLGEMRFGELEGHAASEFRALAPTLKDRFEKAPSGGETLAQVRRRVGEALYEIEAMYVDETILIVTHEQPVLLLKGIAEGLTEQEIHNRFDVHRPDNAVPEEFDFVPLPHNRDYELDYHRPYIDRLELRAPDGARLVRIPEVVDCWLESGSMPFAEYHYPFESKDAFEKRSPGDFIAEYIAQTRTWFYYMHAVGTAVFDRQTFKHVVNTGTILAEDGSKMSKSKGNFTDPLINLDRFGADALRLYLLTSVVMQAEDVKFKDEELKEVHNRTINILWNAFTFYTLYAKEVVAASPDSTHILDRWIRALLSQLVGEVTAALDAFDTVRAGRLLRDFVTDLSTWYIRRSRDRFKSDDTGDKHAALATTQDVLTTLATLIAPLTPFIAEDIYRGAKGKEESVHLASWPVVSEVTGEDRQLLADMEHVREIVSLGLEARARAGIKIRQPLASLTIQKSEQELSPELLALIQDEINVHAVMYGAVAEKVVLDTVLTEALLLEGKVRDVVRSVQDLRKRMELVPHDRVRLMINEDKTFIESCREQLQKIAGVEEIVQTDGEMSIEKL